MSIPPTAEFLKQFLSTIPSHLQPLGAQLQEFLKPQLEAWLQQLDLVTRQEFEQQTQLLLRLETQCAQLQQHLETIEQRLSSRESKG